MKRFVEVFTHACERSRSSWSSPAEMLGAFPSGGAIVAAKAGAVEAASCMGNLVRFETQQRIERQPRREYTPRFFDLSGAAWLGAEELGWGPGSSGARHARRRAT